MAGTGDGKIISQVLRDVTGLSLYLSLRISAHKSRQRKQRNINSGIIPGVVLTGSLVHIYLPVTPRPNRIFPLVCYVFIDNTGKYAPVFYIL